MKKIIFSIVMLISSYSMACSVTPMGYYKWGVDAVMQALIQDNSIALYELVSITNTKNGSEFVVVLKELTEEVNQGKTDVRVYSLVEGPYAEDEPVCGKWTAVLVK